MPLVDYSRAPLDPWKKYDESREYLLKKGALEEDIARRKTFDERALRQLALGERGADIDEAQLKEGMRSAMAGEKLASEEVGLAREQFAEQKRKALSGEELSRAGFGLEQQKLAEQKRKALESEGFAREVYKEQQKTKQQEMLSNMYGFIANSMNIATSENFPMVRQNVVDRLSGSIDIGPGTPEEKQQMKQQIEDSFPDEYDDASINSGFYKLFNKAKEQGLQTINLISDDEKKTKIVVVPENTPYNPGPGWNIVKDFRTLQDKKSKGPTALYDKKSGYTKGQAIDDTRGYYGALLKRFPEDIRMSDEEKMMRDDIVNQMRQDMIEIDSGRKPSWLKASEEVEKKNLGSKSEVTSIKSDISKYLK